MERPKHETTRAIPRRGRQPRRPDERPYLIGVSGEHAGRIFALDDEPHLYLGRTDECQVRLHLDDMVSRCHARLERQPSGEYLVRDLQSLNGTRVNGREIGAAVLRRGDRVDLGEFTTFRFDFLADDERARWESGFLDGLTECFTRRHFDERIKEYFANARSRERALSLLMVDVDRFKRINDELQHQGGDHVLQRVAATLRERLARDHVKSLACRYGGEEFAVVLPDCDAPRCAEIAESLRAAVEREPIEYDRRPVQVSVSVGGATLSPGDETYTDVAELIRCADENLYAAKEAGRNAVVVRPPPATAAPPDPPPRDAP